MITIESILYYLILVDAVSAVVAAWSGYGTKLNKRYSIFGTYFPITRGWTSYYLILVLWLGYALSRLDLVF